MLRTRATLEHVKTLAASVNCNLTVPFFGGKSSMRAAEQQLQSVYSKLFGCMPCMKAAGQRLQSVDSSFLAASLLSKLQGSNYNLTTPDFLAGPVSKLQGRNKS